MMMKLMGFNFNKISAEKNANLTKEVKISTNINVNEIKELKQEEFKIKEDLIGVDFIYSVDYSPDFARIELRGNLLLGIDPKDSKKIIKEWSDKKMDEEFQYALFNLILKKSSLKALEIEEEIGLPLHMPLFNLKKKEDIK